MVYDVQLHEDGVSVQPSGTLTIKLLIPKEAEGRAFRILHLHGDNVTEMEYTIDGAYAVFTVDALSQFAFVVDNQGSALWLILVLAAIVIIELVLIFLKKRKKGRKTATLAAFGGVIAVYEIALIAVLGALALGLGVYTVLLYTRKPKPATTADSADSADSADGAVDNDGANGADE